MAPPDHPSEEDRPPRRPRVVDKRISARSAASPPAEAPGDAGPEPAGTQVRPQPGPAPQPEQAPRSAPAQAEAGDPAARVWTPEQEEAARRLAEQILQTPAENWVLNAAMTLIDVASVKLDGGDLAGSQLAIDALDALIGGVGVRLGDAEGALRRALAELQMAYARRAAGPPPGGPQGN